MGDRLREARIAAGFKSARSAALQFGWGPSTYGAHENGQNGFPPDAADRYAKAFKTTAAWLLIGEGQRPKPKAVISSFDPDAVEPDPVDDEQPEETPRAKAFPVDAIKELASKAGLGSGQTIEVTYARDGKEIVAQDAVLDEFWRIPPPFVRSVLNARIADLLVIECEGDSMRPTLEPHERVVVNTAHKKPSPDGIYAIRNRFEETVVKRLQLVEGETPKVLVISDNPAHPTVERALDEIEIVGKVVLTLKIL